MTATERAATRRRLLEAGKREFAERGLAGARFDEIAIAAGHAKGTIYNYFDSKEALFFSIVEEWCSLLSDAVGVRVEATGRDRVLAIAALDVEIARRDPDLARVVVQQMPALGTSHRAAAEAAIAPGLGLLADAIATGVASGEFRSDHAPAVLARLFLAALSSFELEALGPDSAVELDHVVDLVDRHFLSGLVS